MGVATRGWYFLLRLCWCDLLFAFLSLAFFRRSAPRTEPFTKATMRAFLNQPVEPQTGVIECMIRRKKGVMNTIYQAYYEVITWKKYEWIYFSILSLLVATT